MYPEVLALNLLCLYTCMYSVALWRQALDVPFQIFHSQVGDWDMVGGEKRKKLIHGLVTK